MSNSQMVIICVLLMVIVAMGVAFCAGVTVGGGLIK